MKKAQVAGLRFLFTFVALLFVGIIGRHLAPHPLYYPFVYRHYLHCHRCYVRFSTCGQYSERLIVTINQHLHPFGLSHRRRYSVVKISSTPSGFCRVKAERDN